VGPLALLATRLATGGVGIGARWLIQSTPKINAASLNLGLSILIIPQLTLGFAAYNLIDTHHPELSRSFEVGFGLLLGPSGSRPRSAATSAGAAPSLWNSGWNSSSGGASRSAAAGSGASRCSRTSSPPGVGFVFDNAGLDIGWRHGLAGAGDLLVGGFRIQLQ
jgi:hypothetical protein